MKKISCIVMLVLLLVVSVSIQGSFSDEKIFGIKAEAAQMNVDQAVIDIPKSLVDKVAQAMFDFEPNVEIYQYNLSYESQTVKDIFAAVEYYYPLEYHTYYDSGMSYSYGSNTAYPNVLYRIGFNISGLIDKAEFDSLIIEEQGYIDEIIDYAKDMDDFEKIVFVHDYIVLNNEYDMNYYDLSMTGKITPAIYREFYPFYSVLTNGSSVCGGYTELSKILLNQLGIDCVYITNQAHAWNLVKYDGNWYHMDCTWDDPTDDVVGRTFYNYFMLTDNQIDDDHSKWNYSNLTADDTSFEKISRNTNTHQTYSNNRWYYYKNSKLYSSDKFGKNETYVSSNVGAGLAVYGGYYFYANGKNIIAQSLDDSSDKYIAYTINEKNATSLYSMFVNDDKLIYYYNTASGKVKCQNPVDLSKVISYDITSISLDKTSVSLEDNQTYQFVISEKSGRDLSCCKINWSSSNESVVSVNSKGLAAAVGKGSAIITAKIGTASASSNITVTNNKCGENITWDIIGNKLEISGSGEMSNFTEKESAPWSEYANEIETITLNGEITSIGSYAFSKMANVKSVELTQSIVSIGNHAFNELNLLKSLTIPNGVETIGSYTFNNLTALEELIIPNGVKKLEKKAFCNLGSVKSVVVDKSVEYIASGAFYGFDKLERVTLPFVGSSRIADNTEDAVLGHIFGTTSYQNTDIAVRQSYKYDEEKGSLVFAYCYFIPSTLKKIVITDDEVLPIAAFNNCKIEELELQTPVSQLQKYTLSSAVVNNFYAYNAILEIPRYLYNIKNIYSYTNSNSHIYAASAKINFVSIGSLDNHTHIYDDWEILKNTTCKTEGVEVRHCTTCGIEQTKAIAKNSHIYSQWQIVKSETCSQKGLKQRVCNDCGYKEKIILAVNDEHKDKNKDGYCDECNLLIVKIENCECICHSNSIFVKFVYKIQLVFWQLFGLNQNCDCSIRHY